MNFSLAIKFNRFSIHQCKTVAAFSFVPSIFDCSCLFIVRWIVMHSGNARAFSHERHCNRLGIS